MYVAAPLVPRNEIKEELKTLKLQSSSQVTFTTPAPSNHQEQPVQPKPPMMSLVSLDFKPTAIQIHYTPILWFYIQAPILSTKDWSSTMNNHKPMVKIFYHMTLYNVQWMTFFSKHAKIVPTQVSLSWHPKNSTCLYWSNCREVSEVQNPGKTYKQKILWSMFVQWEEQKKKRRGQIEGWG